MDAHSEIDFIPYVLTCLEATKRASFADLRQYMEKHFPLNRADRAPLPSLGCQRWHQRLRNLKSNKTLILNYYGIKEVRGGFALTD